MKFSYNWIRELVPGLAEAPGPLERLITMKTAECEGVENVCEMIAQTRLALANLRIALEDSGAAIEDVVKTTVYVASSDRGELAAAFDELAAFFGDHDVPSTLLGVALLGYRDQLVEIEAIAVQPTQARRAAASHTATSPAGE